MIEQKKSPPIGPVDDRAAEGGKQDARQTQTETVEAQVKHGVRELEDQPGLRRRLKQRAGVAKKKTEPENPKVAVAKGAKSMAEEHAWRRVAG